MSRRGVQALRVVKSILFLIMGVLAGLIALSVYGILSEPKHLTCVYLNVTSTGDSGADVNIWGVGKQTLVVRDSIYTVRVRVRGFLTFPISIPEPPNNRVLVLSTKCNPYLQVSLVFPNGTTIYGQPQPINDQ
jgi:hypothetical protein